MNLELARAMIQRTYPGQTSRHITCPDNLKPSSLITEKERLAQFEYSRNFHNQERKV
jgi:hypothetical protein